jgi:hypothetical protein
MVVITFVDIRSFHHRLSQFVLVVAIKEILMIKKVENWYLLLEMKSFVSLDFVRHPFVV